MAKSKAKPKPKPEEVVKSRFDPLLNKNDAATVDDRDLLEALYLIGVTLEEIRDRLPK